MFSGILEIHKKMRMPTTYLTDFDVKGRAHLRNTKEKTIKRAVFEPRIIKTTDTWQLYSPRNTIYEAFIPCRSKITRLKY